MEHVVENMDHCFLQQWTERELGILVNLKHYFPAELMNLFPVLKEYSFHIAEYCGQGKNFDSAFSNKFQVLRAAEVLAHCVGLAVCLGLSMCVTVLAQGGNQRALKAHELQITNNAGSS